MTAPWFSMATHFKGITEVRGSVDNPKIIEMFRISGHPEVKDDETPWCAAFVGACLRLSGYKNSGSLGARSYLQFGEDLSGSPRPGCIAVFWRGSKDSWAGHVGFLVREEGDKVFVLGGNQSNAVSINSYPRERLLGYRWPIETAPLPSSSTLPNILAIDPGNAPAHVVNTTLDTSEGSMPVLRPGSVGPHVRALQEKLETLNYPVLGVDGEFGPNTRAALIAFQTDQGLPASGTVDGATRAALGVARPRVADGSDDQKGSAVWSGRNSDIPDLVMHFNHALEALRTQPVAASATPASPIDTMLGGDMLKGKKTLLAVLSYVVLSVLQATNQVGTATGAPSGTVQTTVSTVANPATPSSTSGTAAATTTAPAAATSAPAPSGTTGQIVTSTPGTPTPTGEILTTLIAAFGGLGFLAKIDRALGVLSLLRKPAG